MRQRRSTTGRSATPAGKKRAVRKKLGRNAARRGRPHKFGRPAHVVTLTLPEDVLEALRSVHRDPGWAIVQLVEPMLGNGVRPERPRTKPTAELVRLSGRRALIVVQPDVFAGLPGVSTIKLADGGAFLAFDHDKAGPADLELALTDRLDKESSKGTRRAQLTQARDIVRAWRQDAGLVFRTKSIIVVEGAVDVEPGPLASIHDAEGTGHGDDAREPHGRPPVG